MAAAAAAAGGGVPAAVAGAAVPAAVAAPVAVAAAAPASTVRWQALTQTNATPDNDAVIMPSAASGRKMMFRVTRNSNGNQFIAEQQSTNGDTEFVMAAYKKSTTTGEMFIISSQNGEYKRHGQHFVGKLRCNLTGSNFTLLDNGASPRNLINPPDIIKKQNELAAIMYGSNPMGVYGPRRLTVIVPRPDASGRPIHIPTTPKHDALLQKLRENNLAQITTFRNKQPVWDQVRKTFVLDFFGRVTKASIKNFQIISTNDDIVMQFGRCGDDEFVLDYAHPLNALQAFGIALSSMGHKFSRD